MNDKLNSRSEKFVVLYKNGIFDITDFRHKHPGGTDVLKNYNKRKIDFPYENVGHSKAALYLLNQYKVDSDEKSISNGFSKEFISDESLEHLVDWNKPMLSQIHKLGENYEEWVNLPVDRPLRLFDSDFIESFSRAPWYYIPLFWIPVIIILCYYGTGLIPKDQNKSIVVATVIPIGIASWTLLEYLMHRYFFHFNVENRGTWFKSFHFLFHGNHHKVPLDQYRLVFPPVPGAFIAFLIYLPYSSWKYAFLLMAGKLIGYVLYELTHYFLHYGNPSEATYLYKLKRSHNFHHFTTPDKSYGLSSSFWDNVFGTAIVLKKSKYVIK